MASETRVKVGRVQGGAGRRRNSRRSKQGRARDAGLGRGGFGPQAKRARAGGGRALGARLGEGRGCVGGAAERGGAPSSRSAPERRAQTRERRGGSWKGAGASVSPLTHTPGEALSPAMSRLRAVRPSELPTGNLPQPRLSAESCVHTVSAEGRTVPTRSRSHRPRPAQAHCKQNVSGGGPALGPTPCACAVRTRSAVRRSGATVLPRRRGALGPWWKGPGLGRARRAGAFHLLRRRLPERGRCAPGVRPGLAPGPGRGAGRRVCGPTGRRGSRPGDPPGRESDTHLWATEMAAFRAGPPFSCVSCVIR